MSRLKVIDNLEGVRANARTWACEFTNLSSDARKDLLFEIDNIQAWYPDASHTLVWKQAIRLVKSINIQNNVNSADRREMAILMLTVWAMRHKALRPLPKSFKKHKESARKSFATRMWNEFHEFVAQPDGGHVWSYMDVIVAKAGTPLYQEQREVELVASEAAEVDEMSSPTPQKRKSSDSPEASGTTQKKPRRAATSETENLPARIDNDDDEEDDDGEDDEDFEEDYEDEDYEDEDYEDEDYEDEDYEEDEEKDDGRMKTEMDIKPDGSLLGAGEPIKLEGLPNPRGSYPMYEYTPAGSSSPSEHESELTDDADYWHLTPVPNPHGHLQINEQPTPLGSAQVLADACRRLNCVDDLTALVLQIEGNSRASEDNELAAQNRELEAQVAALERENAALQNEQRRVEFTNQVLRALHSGAKADRDEYKRKWERVRNMLAEMM